MQAVERGREVTARSAAPLDVEVATGWLETISGMLAMGRPIMEIQSFIHRKVVFLGELREAREEGRL